MKFSGNVLAIFIAFNVLGVSSFSFQSPPGSLDAQQKSGMVPGSKPKVVMFPEDMPMKRVEGGGTIRTFHMPMNCERCFYKLTSDGRPLKAKVEMWLGPNRKTHQIVMDCMDGQKTPFRALLKFRAGGQVLKVSGNGNVEYLTNVGVKSVPAEENKDYAAETMKLWKSSEPLILQGGDTAGKPGALRSFPIPDDVESVHVIIDSAEIGRKSSKVKFEVLQGPNNPRQFYDLDLSGGSQPFHCVLMTPGEGAVVRIRSKHFLEFPTKVVVIPYEKSGNPSTSTMGGPTRQWWE